MYVLVVLGLVVLGLGSSLWTVACWGRSKMKAGASWSLNPFRTHELPVPPSTWDGLGSIWYSRLSLRWLPAVAGWWGCAVRAGFRNRASPSKSGCSSVRTSPMVTAGTLPTHPRHGRYGLWEDLLWLSQHPCAPNQVTPELGRTHGWRKRG